MKRAVLGLVLCTASFVLSAQPSLVVIHGKIFTGDPARPAAEAVAVQGNQIVAVGSTDQILAMAPDPKKTTIIDAQGRRVIPGINDAHTHPGNGRASFGLGDDIERPWSEVAAALTGAIDETPPDMWITGSLGPAAINDGSITRETLDKLAPGRKVMLTSFTGHGTILSSPAMKALGIADDAKDPQGGWYERGSDGKLNGRVQEYADFALGAKDVDEEVLLQNIRAFAAEAVQYGITSVQAMPVGSEEAFVKALKKADVPLRVRLMTFPIPAGSKTALSQGGAVKWILDGTPIEKGAALRTAKYADGTRGRMNFEDLAPLVQAAVDSKRQLLLHASGDRAVAESLNAIAKTALERPRIEHADGLQPDLFPLARKTGAIVVVNPTHFPFRGFYPKGDYMLAGSLLRAGIPLAIGSDGPLNPYLNIMLATSRPDQPREALTREEALRAYTTGSAFAEMTEKTKGKIAPGMLADLVILSQDILSVPADGLPATTAVVTIIDGKVVHSQ